MVYFRYDRLTLDFPKGMLKELTDLATERGISCDGHAARQLTNQDYDKYDLLIGMDSANLRNIHRICGGDFAGKLRLLMDYTNHPRDVADPWYTGDFEATWQNVLAGCQGLLREITGHHHTRE